jgi:HAD superfamily hydrolase (TIGR01549 family)
LISPDGIQTLLFDLDGTLRHNRPTANQFFFDFSVDLGVSDSLVGRQQAQRQAHYYWANSKELQRDLRVLDNELDFWHNYTMRQLVAFGCPVEQAEALAPDIHQHMAENFSPRDWIPDEVNQTLQALNEVGFTLGVVSNRANSIEAYVEEIGLRRFVDFTLAAGEVDSWKPDTVIFQQALLRAKSDPTETIYIGDNYYADIIGAQRAGLKPVLLDPDHIFPDADCDVIRTLSEVRDFI